MAARFVNARQSVCMSCPGLEESSPLAHTGDSARFSPYASPTLPIDGRTPASRHRLPKATDVDRQPDRSDESRPSAAASTARNSNPVQVGASVMSTTHHRSGPAAANCGARRLIPQGVRNCFRRLPPCRPGPDMSRAIRLRPTGIPRAANRHELGAPRKAHAIRGGSRGSPRSASHPRGRGSRAAAGATRRGYTQDTAHGGDRKDGLVGRHELESLDGITTCGGVANGSLRGPHFCASRPWKPTSGYRRSQK
jgi:hypothetical protein